MVNKFDLILKGGHIIDPANGINSSMDLGISGGIIGLVEKNISSERANKIIDVSGLLITPGLIDLHAHCFGYQASVYPDELCLPFCTTTMLDAGGSGWKTFDEFKDTVINTSITRVFALLNIVGGGMIEDHEQNVSDMDPEKTAEKILERRDMCVGIKVAHFMAPSWEAVSRGRKAADLSNTFMMIDQNPIHNRTIDQMLNDYMKKGDVLTHVYGYGKPILNKDGKIRESYIKARERGIKFDLGHGAGSFSFRMAEPAMSQGFQPDTISTDHHRSSLLKCHANMPECMTKMLALGMSLEDTIKKSTIIPALQLGHPELGNLSEGSVADVAILKITEGDFGLTDNGQSGNRIYKTNKRINPFMTIKGGEIVWDREGISRDDWSSTPFPDVSFDN
ncbi:MAG: amidohydrolase/deacetylase family metallohydrolase [Chloroflexi bacterium]|nr:amidohydrolase/deacetylase family metallohydrolase [Chloroflexota bacterium]|tara:strand:- start:19030 stop:20208 length:1179 start_codon:yes stop_codon:yes gene_type:complete